MVIYGNSAKKEGADWLVRRAKIQKGDFNMKGETSWRYGSNHKTGLKFKSNHQIQIYGYMQSPYLPVNFNYCFLRR